MIAPYPKGSDYYRVSLDSKNCGVSVMYLGMDSVDDTMSGIYDSVEQLPHWMQERLATLSMLSYEPPTEKVEGVGRRISKRTYWVEKPNPC
jgi:hypothetical protein